MKINCPHCEKEINIKSNVGRKKKQRIYTGNGFVCTNCKIEKDKKEFEKEGKILKTCAICRLKKKNYSDKIREKRRISSRIHYQKYKEKYRQKRLMKKKNK